MHEMMSLLLGADVMIWRENKGWIGPYELKAREGANIIVEIVNGPATFRVIQAKAYHCAPDQPEEAEDNIIVRPEPV
jgi:hypothetical protein